MTPPPLLLPLHTRVLLSCRAGSLVRRHRDRVHGPGCAPARAAVLATLPRGASVRIQPPRPRAKLEGESRGGLRPLATQRRCTSCSVSCSSLTLRATVASCVQGWLALAAGAAAVGLPQGIMYLGKVKTSSQFARLQGVWVNQNEPGPHTVWLEALGLFVPINMLALVLVRQSRPVRHVQIALFVLFCVCNVVIFQPWEVRRGVAVTLASLWPPRVWHPSMRHVSNVPLVPRAVNGRSTTRSCSTFGYSARLGSCRWHWNACGGCVCRASTSWARCSAASSLRCSPSHSCSQAPCASSTRRAPSTRCSISWTWRRGSGSVRTRPSTLVSRPRRRAPTCDR